MMHRLVLLLIIFVQVCSVRSNLLESCLSRGFDPTNLSCDTCALLSATDYHSVCLECCQSYKTLNSKTSRYKQAILVHSHGSEEIDKFIDEELEGIQQTKEGFSVEKAEIPRGAMSFFSMTPNVLYFFKGDAPKTEDNTAYTDLAQETIILHGWSKDDLKDMINTLLPDKK